MSLNRSHETRYGMLVVPSASVDSEGHTGVDLDIGTARDGDLIVMIEYTSGNGITEMTVCTSDVDSFTCAVTTNGISDVTVDATRSTGTITVDAAGLIGPIAADGIYIFHCENLERYVNVEYDCDDTGSVITILFEAYNMEQAPYTAATTAY